MAKATAKKKATVATKTKIASQKTAPKKPAKAAKVTKAKASSAKGVKKAAKEAATDAVNQAAAQVKSVAKTVVGAVNKAIKSAEGIKNEVSRKIALESETAKKAANRVEKALVEKARKTVESVMPTEEAVEVASGEMDPSGLTDQEKKALNRKITQAGSNWEAVYKIAKDLKAKGYKMSESFTPKTPIVHKVLGWGFVLSSENNRIQVLFKDGLKTLITNYQNK
jgi:hypothetical protein